MTRIAATTLLILMGTSAQALAAATPEEAQRLTTVFQAYLGSDPGVVTVAPAGDSYKVVFDLGPHFAKIKEPGASASITPIEWTLTDQGGGKWKVDQDQPLTFAFKVDGAVDMKGSLGSIKGTGVYDETLGAFASTATEIGQAAFEQVITDKGQTSKVNYTVGTIKVQSAMTGTSESADGTTNYTFSDIHETISMPAAPDGSMPAMDVSISASGGSQDATVKGLKPKALTGLLAWFVERPSKEKIIAGQAELKDKLRAALPVFSSMSGTATLDNLDINTMIGKFTVAKLDIGIDANGIVADGAFREKFTVTGLKPPEGIVPPWATNLAPQNFTLDFNVKDFDLAKPAGIILDTLDLTKEPLVPPDVEAQVQQALLPKGSVTIGLGPSEIIASIFDLKAEGSMTAGPMAMPAGQAMIRLKGIDEIMAALQAAPPEMGMGQVAPVGIVAKGMAKQDADGYLSWKIESTPNGSVTINGTDISKIGGGQ